MNDNIIKFPRVFRGKKLPKILDMDAAQIQEDLEFCDNLAEGLMINLIHNVGENGFDIKTEKFLGDIGFLNEAIRGILYRQMGFTHPIQEFINSVVTTRTERDKIYNEVNLAKIDKMFDNIKKDLNDLNNDGQEDDTS